MEQRVTTLVNSRGTIEQDDERAMRMFVGLFRSLLGQDQTDPYLDADPTGERLVQFQIANPDGTASIVGKPVSNVQQGAQPMPVTVGGVPLSWLVLGAAAWLILRN